MKSYFNQIKQHLKSLWSRFFIDNHVESLGRNKPIPASALQFWKEVIILMLIGVFLVVFVWFKGDFIIWCVDTFLGNSNPLERMRMALYVWKDKFSTGVSMPDQGMLIHYLFLSLLQYLDVSLKVQQIVVVSSQFSLTLFGGWYFAYTFLTKKTSDFMVRVAVSLFYAFNLVTLTWVWWRFLNYIYFYPAFIIFVSIFYNFFNRLTKDGFRKIMLNIFKISLLSFFFVPAFTSSITIILFYSLVPIMLMYHCIFLKVNLAQVKKYIIFGMILYVCLLAVNLFHILPQIILLNDLNASAQTVSTNPLEILKEASKYTSLLNVFRLQGEHSIYLNFYGNHLFDIGWLSMLSGNFFFIFSSFLPALSSFLILIIKPRKRIYAFFMVMLICSILVLKGLNEPFKNLLLPFVLSNFGSIFRHPYDKFIYYLLIPYSFFYGKFILFISNKYKFGKMVALVVTLCLTTVLVYPLWTGGVLMNSQNFLPGVKVNIPADYNNLKINPSFTTRGSWLQLPLQSIGGDSAYIWGNGVQLNGKSILDDYIANPVIFSNYGNDAWNAIQASINSAIINKNQSYFLALIRQLGVCVVFVNKDVDFVFMKNKIPFSSIDSISDFLDSMPQFQKDESQNYIVYKTLNCGQRQIFSTDQIFNFHDLDNNDFKYSLIEKGMDRSPNFVLNENGDKFTDIDSLFKSIILSDGNEKKIVDEISRVRDLNDRFTLQLFSSFKNLDYVGSLQNGFLSIHQKNFGKLNIVNDLRVQEKEINLNLN